MQHWTHFEDQAPTQIVTALSEGRAPEHVKIPGFRTSRLPRLAKIFGDAKYIRDVDLVQDTQFVCATEGCPEPMHYVHEGHSKTDGRVVSRAHWRSENIDGHIDGCVFKKPKQPSLQEAIEMGLRVVIHLEGDWGHYGQNYQYSKGGTIRTAFAHWSRTLKGNMVTRSVKSVDEFSEAMERIVALGGDKAVEHVFVHHKGHVLNYASFNMDNPSALEDPRDDMKLHALLTGLSKASSANSDKAYAHGAPRLSRVKIPVNYMYDHESHSIVLPAQEVKTQGRAYWAQPRLYFRELDDGFVREAKARAWIDALIEQKGRDFDILATPRLDPDVAYRTRAALNNSRSWNDMPVASMDWVVVDVARQIKAALPVEHKQEVSSNFVSGALPLTDAERSASPATLQEALSHFQKPKQLRLF